MARPPAKAQELAELLGAQIRAGDPPGGRWLPSERQLAETHCVGRSTVRQAAQILDEQGLVELVPGSGTRVRAAVPAGGQPPADLKAELATIKRQLTAMNARLTALESRLEQSVSDV